MSICMNFLLFLLSILENHSVTSLVFLHCLSLAVFLIVLFMSCRCFLLILPISVLVGLSSLHFVLF